MAVSILWTVDEPSEESEPLFQLSQESTSSTVLTGGGGKETRIKVDYLGDSMQCQLYFDRFFTYVSPAREVYSSIESHLLGVLQGVTSAAFVRMGPRPPQSPLGVLFGEMPLWDGEESNEQIRPKDGIAVRAIKKLFAEMQEEVAIGKDAFSVRMGFCCFMNTPTKPTDLLKNIKQQVPSELEWGDVEGTMPGSYIYLTSVADVLKTLTKLLQSPKFKPVIHRLSYCVHFLILKTPVGVAPSRATTAKVAHLTFTDIHPDHVQAAQRALMPAIQKLQKDKERQTMKKERSMFNGMPLSPRGSAPLSPGRESDGILGKCLGLTTTMTSSRLVLLASAPSTGPLTSQQQVQTDTMISIVQEAQKAGPVPRSRGPTQPSVRYGSQNVIARAPTTSESPPHFSPPMTQNSTPRTLDLQGTPAPPSLAPTTEDERTRHASRHLHTPVRQSSVQELADIAGELHQVQRELTPHESHLDSGIHYDAPTATYDHSAHAEDVIESHGYRRSLSGPGHPTKSDLLVKDCRIQELESQVSSLEARLVQLGGTSGETWLSRVEAENAKRENEGLRMELISERKKHETEIVAWRERLESLESQSTVRIDELQYLLSQQETFSETEMQKQRRDLQNRVLELEQKVVRADQGKEDAAMKSRALAATCEDMKTQVAGLRASCQELETRLQTEAISRDAADREIDRVQTLYQQASEQLSILRKTASDTEVEVRVTRSEMEAVRSQLTDISMEYETEKAASRRVRLQLESMTGVERDRVEEREAADRAKLWADYIEGLHWLAHTCMRWGQHRGSSSVSFVSSSPLRRIDDVNILRERLSQRDSQLYSKTAEAMQLEQDLAEARAMLRDFEREAERRTSMLEDRVRLLEAENTGLAQQCDSQVHELRRVSDLAQHSEADRHGTADDLRKLKAEHAAMKETVDEVMRQRSLAIQEAEMLRRKNSQSETVTDKEAMRLTAELKQRELQITDMRRQTATLQQVADSYQICEGKRRALQQQLTETEGRLKEQERRNEQLQLEVKDSLEVAKNDKKTLEQAESMARRMQSQEVVREKEIQALRSERDRLEAERRSSTEWAQSVQEEIRGKTTTLDNIEKLLREEQAKEAKREAEVKHLEEQLSRSKDEVLSLHQKMLALQEGRGALTPSKQMSPGRPVNPPPATEFDNMPSFSSTATPSGSVYRRRATVRRSGTLSPAVGMLVRGSDAAESESEALATKQQLQEKLAAVERENSRLRRERDDELRRAAGAQVVATQAVAAPIPATLPSEPQLHHRPPSPALARAELQIAQMNNDLASMPYPRPVIPDVSALSRASPFPLRSATPLMSPHTALQTAGASLPLAPVSMPPDAMASFRRATTPPRGSPSPTSYHR